MLLPQTKFVLYCNGQDDIDCTLLNRCASTLSTVVSQPSLNCCAACLCSATCLDHGVGFGPITESRLEEFSSWQLVRHSPTSKLLSYAHENKEDNTLESKWNNALHSELRNIRSIIMVPKRFLLAEASHVGSVFMQHNFMFARDTYIIQSYSVIASRIHNEICCILLPDPIHVSNRSLHSITE